MSYNSLLFIAMGTMMIAVAMIKFNGVLAEGMYEHYRGRLQKIERAEQPTTYWARIVLMLTSGVAGLVMITQGIGISPF
jgi:uncharacterized membrane-anchored protein